MNKYEVIHPHCRGYRVGEIIELSDTSAAQLVGKVKPANANQPAVKTEELTPAKKTAVKATRKAKTDES